MVLNFSSADLFGIWLLWYKEVFFELVQIFKDTRKLLVPLLFLAILVTIVVIFCGAISDHTHILDFTVIYIPKHDESLPTYMFDLRHHLVRIEIIIALIVLIHDIFAETIVPSLQLIVNYFVVYEGAFDVSVTIKT